MSTYAMFEPFDMDNFVKCTKYIKTKVCVRYWPQFVSEHRYSSRFVIANVSLIQNTGRDLKHVVVTSIMRWLRSSPAKTNFFSISTRICDRAMKKYFVSWM